MFGAKKPVKYSVLTRDCFVILNIKLMMSRDDIILVMISDTCIRSYSRKQYETLQYTFKMWNADTEYYTVGSIVTSMNKIVESEANSILLTHIYMTPNTHIHDT